MPTGRGHHRDLDRLPPHDLHALPHVLGAPAQQEDQEYGLHRAYE